MSRKIIEENHWIRKYFVEILVVIVLSFSSYIGITAVNNKTEIASVKSENVMMYDMVKETNNIVKDIQKNLIIKADELKLEQTQKQVQQNKEDIIKLKK